MIFEFFAASLFGEGEANTAATLAGIMNQGRALNPWNFKEVDEARGPLLNIAAEIAWHRRAR